MKVHQRLEQNTTKMTPERYDQLQDGPDPQKLTPVELKECWHWCSEMDDLLCIVGGSDCFCVVETNIDLYVPVDVSDIA